MTYFGLKSFDQPIITICETHRIKEAYLLSMVYAGKNKNFYFDANLKAETACCSNVKNVKIPEKKKTTTLWCKRKTFTFQCEETPNYRFPAKETKHIFVCSRSCHTKSLESKYLTEIL